MIPMHAHHRKRRVQMGKQQGIVNLLNLGKVEDTIAKANRIHFMLTIYMALEYQGCHPARYVFVRKFFLTSRDSGSKSNTPFRLRRTVPAYVI